MVRDPDFMAQLKSESDVLKTGEDENTAIRDRFKLRNLQSARALEGRGATSKVPALFWCCGHLFDYNISKKRILIYGFCAYIATAFQPSQFASSCADTFWICVATTQHY